MDEFENWLSLLIGSLAILLGRRWVEDARDDPSRGGSLSGYRKLYASYMKGRTGEVVMRIVRIVGALLVVIGVVGLVG